MKHASDVATGAVTAGIDRRPLPVRDRWAFTRSARVLAHAGATPNAISMTGLAMGVLSGFALAATTWAEVGVTQRALWLAGVVLIQLRGVCNILDGVVAVQSGSRSRVGLLYNEIPDRVSDAATMIGAGYALGGSSVLGWAAAVTAVFVAYVRAQCRLAGAPSDYGGPMAKPMRMVVVVVAAAYAALTPSAWHWRWGPDDTWGIMAAALLVVVVGGVVTAWRRIVRAARLLQVDEP